MVFQKKINTLLPQKLSSKFVINIFKQFIFIQKLSGAQARWKRAWLAERAELLEEPAAEAVWGDAHEGGGDQSHGGGGNGPRREKDVSGRHFLCFKFEIFLYGLILAVVYGKVPHVSLPFSPFLLLWLPAFKTSSVTLLSFLFLLLPPLFSLPPISVPAAGGRKRTSLGKKRKEKSRILHSQNPSLLLLLAEKRKEKSAPRFPPSFFVAIDFLSLVFSGRWRWIPVFHLREK